ncbi:MAG: protein kinase [Kofleriaceae bacterium]
MAEEFPPFRYVAPVDPNIGRRVDSYFVLRSLLGRGGMGAAYLAEHEARAHVKCVVKLVLPELARNPLVISRYRTETEAVSVLKHENIVKLHNFGVLDDGQLFMRFEFVEGKSLDRYVAERGGVLSLREAAYFIFQVCDALDYAHSCGVVHRDLKPDNLMVEASPRGSHLTERIKILDFGIAKVDSTSERTGSGVQMGTPRYMPPEQVTNAASVTGHSDVFAMATIFYLVVTGRLPWGTPESDIAIYHKQKTEAPIRPSEDVMPGGAWALLARSLSLFPEDRPTMREFAIELACAINAEDGLPSGTEILKDVKRGWVTSSPPHAQTLPRPVAAPLITPAPVARAMDGARHPSAGDRHIRPSTPAQGHGPSPPPADLTVTANARPRAVAASLASAAGATFGAPMVAPSTPEALPRLRPPTPVMAAMNTGLLSQGFAAQGSSAGMPQASMAVAAEIETAIGTPGPQAYAHRELPAVVVSNTQLSGVTGQPYAPARSHGQPELPPVLILPGFERRSSRRKVAIGVGLCIAAGIVSFAVSRRSSPPETSATNDGPTSTRRSEPAPAAPVARDTRAPALETSSPVDVPPIAADAAQIDAAATAISMGSATTPTAPRRATSRPDEQPSPPAAVSPPAVGDKRIAGVKPEVPRPAVPRPPAAQKLSLHDRQLEARANGAKTGNLHLLVTPWAVCWVDGEQIDQTPCILDGLPVGRYRVRLQNNVAHKDETLTAAVTAGETTTIERTW